MGSTANSLSALKTHKGDWLHEDKVDPDLLYATKERFQRATLILSESVPWAYQLLLKSNILFWQTDLEITAAAACHKKTHENYIKLNCPSFEQLTDREAAGALLHECFHVRLNHHRWIHNLDELQKSSLNVAADAVINDFIFENYKEVTLPYWAITGKGIFGITTLGMKTMEVYDLVLRHDGLREGRSYKSSLNRNIIRATARRIQADWHCRTLWPE